MANDRNDDKRREFVAGDTLPSTDTHRAAMNAYVGLLKLKNYSNSTIRNYQKWFEIFLNHFPGRKPSAITKTEIMDFMQERRQMKSWSATAPLWRKRPLVPLNLLRSPNATIFHKKFL